MPKTKSLTQYQTDQKPANESPADALGKELDYVNEDATINEKPATPKTEASKVQSKPFIPPISARRMPANGGLPPVSKDMAAREKQAEETRAEGVKNMQKVKAAGKKPADKSAKQSDAADTKLKDAEFDKGAAANRKTPKQAEAKPEAKTDAKSTKKVLTGTVEKDTPLPSHNIPTTEIALAGDAANLFRLTNVGVQLQVDKRTLTREQWLSMGGTLKAAGDGVDWGKIDFLLLGEDLFGEEYAQFAELVGWQPGTIANYMSGLGKYTPAERVPGVSISDHYTVAYADKAVRQSLLLRVRAGEIHSNAQLREALREAKGLPARTSTSGGSNGSGLTSPSNGQTSTPTTPTAQTGETPTADAPASTTGQPAAPQHEAGHVLEQLAMDGNGTVVAPTEATQGGTWVVALSNLPYFHEDRGWLVPASGENLDPKLAAFLAGLQPQQELRITISVLVP